MSCDLSRLLLSGKLSDASLMYLWNTIASEREPSAHGVQTGSGCVAVVDAGDGVRIVISVNLDRGVTSYQVLLHVEMLRCL